MHILQPKHIKLKSEELKELIEKYNISLSQLPVIKSEDPALPEGCEKGDVVKIQRKGTDQSIVPYYRIIV